MKIIQIAPFFGIRSKGASFVAQLSLPGFLSGLGFLPGCERCFGFFGFFGFVGIAAIVEGLSRLGKRGTVVLMFAFLFSTFSMSSAQEPDRAALKAKDGNAVDTTQKSGVTILKARDGKALVVDSGAGNEPALPTGPTILKTNDGKVLVYNVEWVKQMFIEAQGFYDAGRFDMARKRCEQILNIDRYNIAARQMEERIDRKMSGSDGFTGEGKSDPATVRGANPAMSSGAQCFAPSPFDKSIAGVGIQLSAKDGAIIIGDVLPESAAAANRLIQKGDRLLAVGEGYDQAPAVLTGKTLEEVVAMIRGKAGSIVRLLVSPAGKDGSSLREVALIRGNLSKLFQRSSPPPAMPEGGLKSGQSAPTAPPAGISTQAELDVAMGRFDSAASLRAYSTPEESGDNNATTLTLQDGANDTGNLTLSLPSYPPAENQAATTVVTRIYGITPVPGIRADGEAEARKAHAQSRADLKRLINEAIRIAGLAAKEPELTWLDSYIIIVRATATQQDLIAQAIAAMKVSGGREPAGGAEKSASMFR